MIRQLFSVHRNRCMQNEHEIEVNIKGPTGQILFIQTWLTCVCVCVSAAASHPDVALTSSFSYCLQPDIHICWCCDCVTLKYDLSRAVSMGTTFLALGCFPSCRSYEWKDNLQKRNRNRRKAVNVIWIILCAAVCCLVCMLNSWPGKLQETGFDLHRWWIVCMPLGAPVNHWEFLTSEM